MMHSKVRVAMFVLSLIFLGGCAGVTQGRPVRANYQDSIVKSLVKKYSAEDAIFANQSGMTVKQRNEVLDDLIFLTDVNYHRFEEELYLGKAFFDTSGDLAILGLGAAGGLITHSATQAIISAISGGIGGARVSINKNFFHEYSTQALIAKMQASRKTKLATIREAMALEIKDYSLSRGLSDIADYYNVGTIVGALQDIVADAGAEKKKSDQELKKLIKGKYIKTIAGETLRKFWKPDGKTIDQANEQKLQQWMKENGFDTGTGAITMFLRNEMLEDARVKAVEDLKLNE